MVTQLICGLILFTALGGKADPKPTGVFEKCLGHCQESVHVDYQKIVQKLIPKNIPDCSQLLAKTRTPEFGKACRTSVGTIFLRVDNGWQDLGQNGKIWFDAIANGVDQEGARNFCKSFPEQTLPSKEDYLVGEKHGLREVLPEMVQYFNWSTAVVPGSGGYGFSSSSGTLALMKSHQYAPYVVGRCVRTP